MKHTLSKDCPCKPKVKSYNRNFVGVKQDIQAYKKALEEAKAANRRIGMTIKLTRTQQGLTIREFAELVGISHTYLHDIEKGKRGISSELIDKLTNAHA